MKSEMDLLRFDERQRLAWLLANRGTVIAVGVIWIGMIVWELAQDRVPLIMIAAVPAIALLRVGLFFYYNATPSDPAEPPRGAGLGGYLKVVAALMLVVALFLPLYAHAGSGAASGGESSMRYHFVSDLLVEDWTWAIPLGFAFFWPLPVWILMRRPFVRRFLVVAQWAEPLLAVASILLILWIPTVLFEFRQVFWFVFVLQNAQPQAGCYLAVAANGVYLLGWLFTVLRFSVVHSSPAA